MKEEKSRQVGGEVEACRKRVRGMKEERRNM
jgi:hypothetical protein